MANKDVLNTEEIANKIKDLDEWKSEGDKKLTKTFDFKNFKEALVFTNQVGGIAEDKMHHPDIYLTWGKVSIEIQTHEADGLTDDDFELAKAIDDMDDVENDTYKFWN